MRGVGVDDEGSKGFLRSAVGSTKGGRRGRYVTGIEEEAFMAFCLCQHGYFLLVSTRHPVLSYLLVHAIDSVSSITGTLFSVLFCPCVCYSLSFLCCFPTSTLLRICIP